MGFLPRFPLIVGTLFCGTLVCSHGCLPSLDVPAEPASTGEPVDLAIREDLPKTPDASLTVATISPPMGKVSGGEEVTVRGRGFRGDMKVSFYRSLRTSISTTINAQIIGNISSDSFKMMVPAAPDRMSHGPVGIVIDLPDKSQWRSNEGIFSYHTDRISFGPPSEINREYNGMQVILGTDINGDGKTDVVVAKNRFNLFGFSRQGTTTAAGPQFTPEAGFLHGLPMNLPVAAQAHRLIATDVTGDSVPDLLLARGDGVYRCTGQKSVDSPKFGCKDPVNLFTGTYSALDPRKVTIHAIDISKVKQHVIVSQTAVSNGGTVSLDFRSFEKIDVSLNIADPKPAFVSAISSLAVVNSDTASSSYRLAVGLSSGTSENLQIFRVQQEMSNGPIQLTGEPKLSISEGPGAMLVSDLDMDENADLVIASESGAIDLVYGVSGGRFDPVVVNIRKPLSPVQLRVQDVNGDRYPDLVYLAGSNVFVRENASARDFKPESKFLDSASGWSAFDVVPLDASETLPDLILANGSTKQLSYSLNQSK